MLLSVRQFKAKCQSKSFVKKSVQFNSSNSEFNQNSESDQNVLSQKAHKNAVERLNQVKANHQLERRLFL